MMAQHRDGLECAALLYACFTPVESCYLSHCVVEARMALNDMKLFFISFPILFRYVCLNVIA